MTSGSLSRSKRLSTSCSVKRRRISRSVSRKICISRTPVIETTLASSFRAVARNLRAKRLVERRQFGIQQRLRQRILRISQDDEEGNIQMSSDVGGQPFQHSGHGLWVKVGVGAVVSTQYLGRRQ